MKNKYLVALHIFSDMGQTIEEYQDHEIIEADSEKEALKIYNTKNNCSYYYGNIVASVIDGKLKLEEINSQAPLKLIKELIQ